MKLKNIFIVVVYFSITSCTTTGEVKELAENEAGPIISKFERVVDAPISKVYAIVADIEQHPRLLRNIKGREIVDASLIADAIESNEVVALTIAVEPTDRLAITKWKFFPNERIEEQMLTDPFAEFGAEPLDRKKGNIMWEFSEVDGGTLVNTTSEFFPKTGRVYSKEWVDAIWNDFFDRLDKIVALE